MTDQSPEKPVLPPEPVYLKDYKVPDFLIDKVELDISLDPTGTVVKSNLTLYRNPLSEQRRAPLILDGDGLKLESVALNGRPLEKDEYEADDRRLVIRNIVDEFLHLETTVSIDPENNKALSGLYRSQNVYCTQCEPEGFRRITWYIDRPDVLSTFLVRLEADKTETPILLANGNLIETGELDGGRHFARWYDPFKKPSYLFALVGGDLAMVEDHFTTMSGRDITLRIFVEPGKEDRCDWAMDSLKRSMKWDEERFGREYDLDLFMIVAVSDFNMGAMENKGLNIFNDKLILARPDTATDADYANIERVIAHEYFHNWTGNRITCRDWFQLCLKEGLTVYRDQEFSSDERERTVQRIKDVRHLQSFQFPEDAGPLAHPVRPDHFIEINNFYTSTVYEKGAELVRMIDTLLGRETFRKGLDLYFDRHDGEAATVEQFLKCFEDASGRDLAQFMLWYEQAGTPQIACSLDYRDNEQSATLKVTQLLPPTPGQDRKESQLIPLKMALLDSRGNDMPLRLKDGREVADGILELTRREHSFEFTDVTEKPALSLLRGFSAPVTLNASMADDELLFLMRHDSDLFNRWQAAQSCQRRLLIGNIEAMKAGKEIDNGAAFAAALLQSLQDDDLDPAFRAQLLVFPGENDIAREIGKEIDPDVIHAARKQLRANIGESLADPLLQIYRQLADDGAFSPDAASAGRRGLRHGALGLLVATGQPEMFTLLSEHYFNADNMTEAATGLDHLVISGAPDRDMALKHFYERWKEDHLVIDKWFAFQAMAPQEDTLDRLGKLIEDPLFSIRNPNKVRAVIGAFAMGNPVQFNRADGEGYRFVTGKILEIDGFNPQIASRLAGSFKSWKILEPGRRKQIKAALDELAAHKELSKDCFEILSKVIQ